MEVRAQWQSVPKFTMDDHFTAEERTPGIYWIGGWVGPRTRLYSFYCKSFVFQPVAYFL
jgi:hypothetical protein